MRRRWIVLVAVLLAGSGLLLWRSMRPPRVRVARVVRGSAVEAVYASGTIEAEDRVELRARVPGPVAELRVRAGDPVEAGELLARIEAPALQFEVARGRAELNAALRRVDTEPLLAQLRAQGDALRVQRSQARADLRRAEQLAAGGALAPQALDRARAAVAGLEAQLAANAAQQREARIVLDADAARQRAGVASLQARASDAELRAPMDGVVLARHVDPGQTVAVNEGILRIGDMDRLHLEAQVDESDVARVRVGQSAAIRLYAFGERVFLARVTHVAPDADRDRKAFAVELALEDPPAGLRPGMTAEIDIVVRHREGVLLTAPEALRDGRAWAVGADGRVRLRPVEVGIRDLQRVELLRGVDEGDRLVLGPAPALREGMRVRVEEVALPRSVGLARERPGPVIP